jgi:pimeloyl-ACP methyl ester carboxylesterase
MSFGRSLHAIRATGVPSGVSRLVSPTREFRMRRLAINVVVLVCAMASFQALAGTSPQATGADCHIGSYRLGNGRVIDIAPSTGNHLRWRLADGTTGELTHAGDTAWTSTLGWTERSDGHRVVFGDCASGAIRFDADPGKRIPFDVTETRFASGGASLAGRLVLPSGNTRVPIVVLVHGAEHDSARESYALQRLFPAMGIGAFVYDKRGTGASGGEYTMYYLLLADDAITAMREAWRLAGARAGRIGYQGGSQGGWVAPLAAKIEPVDFVIVGFGLAVSPLEEDRSAIVLDMTRPGYGPDVVAKAMEVADATAAVLSSGFRDGYDKVAAVRAKYGNAPWFKQVHGNVSFFILEHSEAEVRKAGPAMLPGVPLHYDPMPVLRNLRTPQLWILGAEDIDAPSAETARRLATLAADGAPIATAVFPHAEHGIYEFETAADGTRLSTRQPDGYFRMMCDFIRDGRLQPPYGTASLSGALPR